MKGHARTFVAAFGAASTRISRVLNRRSAPWGRTRTPPPPVAPGSRGNGTFATPGWTRSRLPDAQTSQEGVFFYRFEPIRPHHCDPPRRPHGTFGPGFLPAALDGDIRIKLTRAVYWKLVLLLCSVHPGPGSDSKRFDGREMSGSFPTHGPTCCDVLVIVVLGFLFLFLSVNSGTLKSLFQQGRNVHGCRCLHDRSSTCEINNLKKKWRQNVKCDPEGINWTFLLLFLVVIMEPLI